MSGKEKGEIKWEKDLYSEKLCKHRSVMSVSSNVFRRELVLGAYSKPESGCPSFVFLLNIFFIFLLVSFDISFFIVIVISIFLFFYPFYS